MKKRWLLTLSVYCLGIATVPGVLIGARWWQNVERHAPKFVDFQTVAAKAESSIDIAQSKSVDDLEVADFQTEPARPRPAGKRALVNAVLVDEELVVSEAKPLQIDFETPTVAQNSPIRVSISEDAFDAPEPVVRQRSVPATPKAEQPDGIESLAETSPSDEQKAKLTTLREKLAELTKAKAELVNEQTLEETIFSLEKQISNLHAAQKLLSAKQILQALAEEFPDSPAAAKAQRMLEAAESKKAPKPSPDPLSALPTYR